MGLTLASLVVKLMADAADYKKTFEEAEQKASGLSQKIGAFGQKTAAIGAGMTAGFTVPIVAGFAGAIDAASDMNETMSKVGVVFGEDAAAVQNWASTSASSMGISKQAALDAAGTYGNLFVSMGMTTQESANMSTSLVALSSDLASFNNMDPTEVLEKLRAGLVGETEPLKSLGVNLNAATVEAKAFQLGLVEANVDAVKVSGALLNLEKATNAYKLELVKSGKDSMAAREAYQKLAEANSAVEKAMAGSKVELTAAQKAQATYALIMDQTKTAQGDFARTSDGLANSQRIVKAEFNNAAAELGENLLPIALQVVTGLKDLFKWFSSLSPEMKTIIVVVAGLVAGIGPLLTVIGTLTTVFSAIMPVIAAVGTVLSGPLIVAIGAVVAIAATLYLAWENNWFGIRDIIAEGAAKIQEIFNSIKSFLDRHGTEIKGVLDGAWQAVKGVFDTVTGTISGIVKTFLLILKGDWKGALETMKSTTDNLFNGIKTVIDGVMKAIVNLIALALDGSLKTVQEKVGSMKDAFVNTLNEVVKFMQGLPAKFIEFGKAMIQGLIDGLAAMGGKLKEKLFELIPVAIREFLGISSPSTLMTYYGQQSALGYMIGWDKTMQPLAIPGVSGFGLQDFSFSGANAQRAFVSAGQSAPGPTREVTINFNGAVHVRSEADMDMLARRIAERIGQGV